MDPIKCWSKLTGSVDRKKRFHIFFRPSSPILDTFFVHHRRIYGNYRISRLGTTFDELGQQQILGYLLGKDKNPE
jgi:hypothetical protein